MSQFRTTITLRGSNGRTASQTFDTKNYNTGTLQGDFLQATNDAASMADAYSAITKAEIASLSVAYLLPAYSSSALPADGDTYEKANVVCYLSAPGALEKTTNQVIVAPVSGIFKGVSGVDRDIVDITDGDLTAFIAEIAANFLRSDGESINTATGDDGMRSGVRTTTTLAKPSL